MCGRFTLRTPTPVLMEQFRLETMPELTPRYNIAPTQTISAVRAAGDKIESGREFAQFRWGLVPSWAKELSIGAKMINARAEGVAEKPSFRAAFKRRRCLVMADGYYEWQASGGKKQPYYIRLADESPFGLAGLWETWKSPEGKLIETCSLMTTAANAFTEPIHNRMPVILAPADYDLWLDPQMIDREKLEPLLAPSDMKLRANPVSTLVNKATNDVPACIDPL